MEKVHRIMRLIPHDLVRFKNITDLVFESPTPEWTFGVVARVQFAVVRRARIIDEKIPVGIRGRNRSQRAAAAIAQSNIVQVITPEELALSKMWRNNKHLQETGISDALEFVDSVLSEKDFKWGPTGSTGFELASGIPTVTENSDLDIIIRASEFISIYTSKKLLDALRQAPVKIDIQLETPKGSVAMDEYERGGSSIILRTISGPILVESPWI